LEDVFGAPYLLMNAFSGSTPRWHEHPSMNHPGSDCACGERIAASDKGSRVVFKNDSSASRWHTAPVSRCVGARSGVQVSSLRMERAMMSFQPGQDLVRSDLVTLGEDGPYRLTIHHSHGVIVEYFQTTAAALHRQGALEDILSAVAWHGAAQARVECS
jgi:hypothetical protein